MYEHRVTANMLAAALGKEKYKDAHQHTEVDIDVVASPFEEGILDIIPRTSVEQVKGDIDIPYPFRTFLHNVVRPALSRIHVKGIAGIKKLTPITVSLVQAFTKSIKLDDRRWRLPLDRRFIASKSIPLERLIRMIRSSGLIIEEQIVYRTKARVFESIRKAGFSIIPRQEEDIEAFVVSAPSHLDITEGPLAFLMANSSTDYTYAITVGSNLRNITRFPWVDGRRTITNDIHEISQFYGVEAARSYFIYELLEILASIASLSPHNLTLMADIIFSRGLGIGVKFTGESKRGTKGLALGTFEKFKVSIFEAAAYGTEESTQSYSVAILTGRHVPVNVFALDDLSYLKKISDDITLQRMYRHAPERFREAEVPKPVEEKPTEIKDINPLQMFQSLTDIMVSSTFTRSETTSWPEVDESLVVNTPRSIEGRPLPSVYINMVATYTDIVIQRWQALDPEERVADEEDYYLETLHAADARYTYVLTNWEHLVYSQLRELLSSQSFTEVTFDSDPDYIDLNWIQTGSDEIIDKRAFTVRSYLKNILDNGKLTFVNKYRLYKELERQFPKIHRRHMAQTVPLTEDLKDLDFSEGQIYIIRPVSGQAYSGRGIEVVKSIEEARESWNRLKNTNPIASTYITNPLTWNGLKMHMRVYFIIARGPNVPGGYLHQVWDFARIFTASQPYVANDFANKDIHDSHGKSTPRDIFFPEDLQVPVGSEYNQASLANHIMTQINTICDAVSHIAAANVGNYPETVNGYEVFGCDFLVTDETQDFRVYLMEINARIGISGIEILPGYNPQTGPWPEKYQRFSKGYFDWIYHTVIGPTFANRQAAVEEPVVEVEAPVVAVTPPVPINVTATLSTESGVIAEQYKLPIPEWIRDIPTHNYLNSMNANLPEYTLAGYYDLVEYLVQRSKLVLNKK
jgi:hypothetical protein